AHPRPGPGARHRRAHPEVPSRSSWLMSPSAAAFDETVEHHFAAGLVEIDRELVAVHSRDGAGPELEMEHTVARAEGRGRSGGLGDEFALDHQRTAAPGTGAAARGEVARAAPAGPAGAVGLRTLPAGRRIGRAEG